MVLPWPNIGPRARGILIFIVGVLLLGNFFGFYFHAADGLAGLGFILSPILLALGLRTFAGDGWGDAGFVLHLQGNLGVYDPCSFCFRF